MLVNSLVPISGEGILGCKDKPAIATSPGSTTLRAILGKMANYRRLSDISLSDLVGTMLAFVALFTFYSLS